MYLLKTKKQLIPSVPQTNLVLSDFSALQPIFKSELALCQGKKKTHWRCSFVPSLYLHKPSPSMWVVSVMPADLPDVGKSASFRCPASPKTPVHEPLSKFYRTKQQHDGESLVS